MNSSFKNVTLTGLAPRQSADKVADPEPRVEPGRLRTVHEVRDPAPAPAQAVAGVELGAVLRMGNEVVLRVLRDLGANLIVG